MSDDRKSRIPSVINTQIFGTCFAKQLSVAESRGGSGAAILWIMETFEIDHTIVAKLKSCRLIF
jgi:hypothetical protein